MKSDDKLLDELQRAAEGLLFMSESDYPFATVRWEGLSELTPQFLRRQAGQPEDSPVNIVGVDYFFRTAVSEESWRSEEERQSARQYRSLLKILKDNLEDLKVYRVGEIDILVYIVGRSPAGNWLGVSTRVVET